ncbi:MAG TPA: triose-phosphate isomerase [Candidatus Paceibacterota bacterium]
MATDKRIKRLIVANWKMNPSSKIDAMKMFGEARKAGARATRVQTVVCAPFPFLSAMALEITGHRTALGAQDCFYERSGAYTGEVSPSQLSSLGVRFVILGHSERREMGESNELVSRKVAAALKEGLIVILCVGERARDDEGNYFSLVKQQLEECLRDIPRRYFLNLCVAYEPIWAISTHASGVESPEDMLQMGIFIRKTLGAICGKDLAVKVPILYGGSVDEKSIAGFIERGGVDGALVGKASLLPETFTQIIKSANESKID